MIFEDFGVMCMGLSVSIIVEILEEVLELLVNLMLVEFVVFELKNG